MMSNKLKQDKRKFILNSSDYETKPISNQLIITIQAYQTKLQREENIKYGRKAGTVSFVYAGKALDNLIKTLLGRENE